MALLQLYIAEDWPDHPASALPWALRDSQGRVLSAGCSVLSELPKADACEAIVAAGAVLLTATKLPKGGRKKLRQLLPYAVEEQIVSEPESVHVALGPLVDGEGHALAVVDKAWIGRMLARLSEAGLRPRHVWPETLLGPHQIGHWGLIWRGSGGVVRTGDAAGITLDCGSVDAPPLALVTAVRGAREKGRAPRGIVLHKDGPAALPDLARWAEALGLPVEMGADWDWSAQALVDPGLGLDLLQGDFAPAALPRDLWPKLRPLLMLAAAILALQVGGASMDWLLLKRETGQLQAEMEQIFRKAFPAATAVVDAPLQMRRNLAQLHAESGQMGATDFLPLMSRLSGVVANSGNVSLRSAVYESGQLRVEMTLPDAQTAQILKQHLQSAGVTSTVDSLTAKDRGMLARMTLKGEGS